MTDTRDSFEKIAQELRERAETADMVLGRVGQYELKAYAGRIAALQAGAGDDTARIDYLESLAVADIDEKAITRLLIFNLWRGTTYDDLRTAIDNAQATEGK